MCDRTCYNNKFECLLSGAVGVAGVALLIYLGAPTTTARLWLRALRNGGLILSGATADDRAVAGPCANNNILHGYLVIACKNGFYLRLEKLDDAVVVRIIRDAPNIQASNHVVKLKQKQDARGNCYWWLP